MPQEKLSADAVIERLISLLQSSPAATADLPQGWQTPGYWQELFNKNAKMRRLMETLQELPAFTNQAPAGNDAQHWIELMDRDFKGPAHARPNHVHQWVQGIVKATADEPAPKEIKRWRDRFGKNQGVQRVRPKEWNGYLHNPHRGTTTFQRFQGDETYPDWITSDTHGPIEFQPDAPVKDNVKYAPKTTLTYCRWPWALLEPKKGKFNWKLIDQTLKTARNRGQTAQLRFQPYTQRVDYKDAPPTSKRHPPEMSVNVPDWYWDTGAPWVEQGVYAKNEPDSNHPLYLKHFGEFIRAFAKRYDGHPDIESIDMAYAGFWGESGGNSTPETAYKLVDIYLKAFKKTQLLSMLGTPGCSHAAAKTAKSKQNIGWRADCFGDLRSFPHPDVPTDQLWTHTFDLYPKEIDQCGTKETWQKAPVTMETCGNVGTWFMHDYDLDLIMREGYRYHMSVFMPKNVFFPEAWAEKLAEFDKKIGYRFALRQLLLPLEAKPDQKINLEWFIDNVGCAPIYRPYALALRFTQNGKGKIVRLKRDIRTWQPGHSWFQEQITVPAGLKKGEVTVDMVIVDEKDKPKVWFAMEARTDDGWHPLTQMDIV